MGGMVIGEVAAGVAKGVAEPTAKEAGKTARYVIEKDPDVVLVPAKMVGYTGGAFVALIFIFLIVGMLFFAIKYLI